MSYRERYREEQFVGRGNYGINTNLFRQSLLGHITEDTANLRGQKDHAGRTYAEVAIAHPEGSGHTPFYASPEHHHLQVEFHGR